MFHACRDLFKTFGVKNFNGDTQMDLNRVKDCIRESVVVRHESSYEVKWIEGSIIISENRLVLYNRDGTVNLSTCYDPRSLELSSMNVGLADILDWFERGCNRKTKSFESDCPPESDCPFESDCPQEGVPSAHPFERSVVTTKFSIFDVSRVKTREWLPKMVKSRPGLEGKIKNSSNWKFYINETFLAKLTPTHVASKDRIMYFDKKMDLPSLFLILDGWIAHGYSKGKTLIEWFSPWSRTSTEKIKFNQMYVEGDVSEISKALEFRKMALQVAYEEVLSIIKSNATLGKFSIRIDQLDPEIVEKLTKDGFIVKDGAVRW
jgi:hypothetical protein